MSSLGETVGLILHTSLYPINRAPRIIDKGIRNIPTNFQPPILLSHTNQDTIPKYLTPVNWW